MCGTRGPGTALGCTGAGASRKHWGLTAGELMTAPAITIHPDATISAAARVMNHHHVKCLPVVDAAGMLAGLVSRRELLSIFLRPDEEIADDVRAVFAEILLADPARRGRGGQGRHRDPDRPARASG